MNRVSVPRVKLYYVIPALFLAFTDPVQLGTANVVFHVHHKFTGENDSLTEYKHHDSSRHRRILYGADIPIGGDNLLGSTSLYFTKIQIGSPPRDYHVQIDTGSDILWVNCAGCTSCPKRSDLGIPLSPYDPLQSESSDIITCDHVLCTPSLNHTNLGCMFGTPHCTYLVRYGDGSSTSGYFVTDRVQLNRISGDYQTTVMEGDIMFGCGSTQLGGLRSSQLALDGIMGFGQANSSLLSQLASSKKVKKMFSHCLSRSKGGIFAIGEVVHPKVPTTPILPNMIHFTVELLAIVVGEEFITFPPHKFNTPAKRGSIIDSGTTLAYFPEEIYVQLEEKIMAAQPHAKIHVGNQFKCYTRRMNVDEVFPVITFYFANSLRLRVYPHQYLLKNHGHSRCIGFMSNGGQPRQEKNVILLGDVVLTDKLVIYNMEDQTVGWTDYDCSSSIKVRDEHTGLVYEVGAHAISWAGRVRVSIFVWLVFIIGGTKIVMY